MVAGLLVRGIGRGDRVGIWAPSSPEWFFKIPLYVHLVDEFPMTVTGKIRKVEMRERSLELLDR